MTTFNYTFDTEIPDGQDNPVEADDRMRETKSAIQERENVDHYWPLTGSEVLDADTGEHRKVTLRTGSAPTAVADKGFVYAKDVSGKAELFYRDEDGNELQLTSGGNLHSSSGITMLTGKTLTTGIIRAVDATGVLLKDVGGDTVITIQNDGKALLADGARFATDAAPATTYNIANKKYVDNATSFGAGASKNKDTNYTATTDGLLVVDFTAKATDNSGTALVTVLSDDNATPTTEVGRGGIVEGGLGFVNGTELHGTITVPILSSKKYRITDTETNGDVTFNSIRFYPIGS